MESRLELQALLEEILGSANVYFNPPESVRMKYDAIKYSRSQIENRYASNSIYKQFNKYEVIVIHEDPECETVGKVSQLPMCTHNRQYVADGLIHDVFTLYYK